MIRTTTLSIVFAACSPTRVPGSSPGKGAPLEEVGGQPSGEVLYDDTVLHEVEIEVDSDDWDTLRHQQRNVFEMFDTLVRTRHSEARLPATGRQNAPAGLCAAV